MKRRFIFSFFKAILGVAILFFLAMIYWSMEIQEARFLDLEQRINLLEKRGPLASDKPLLERTHKSTPKEGNLLKEDPYFEKTLPAMLPNPFSPHGTRRQPLFGGKPDSLHPFNNWSNLRDVMSLCTGGLANSKFGIYETLAPGFAESIVEEEKGLRYRVVLRDGLMWAPLSRKNFPANFKLSDHFLKSHPVTSRDFSFYIDAIKNPYIALPGAVALRGMYEDLDHIEIVSDKEFVVVWRSPRYISRLRTGGLLPLAFFVYGYFPNGTKILEEMEEDSSIYQKSPLFAQNFSEHFAKNVIPSAGPFLFEEMNEREIRLKRNPHYFNPLQALVDEVLFVIKETPENGWIAFKEGSLDTIELQPMQIADLETFLKSPLYLEQEKAGKKIHRLSYVSRAYLYLGWNMKDPLFKSKKVRQALTMTIDRDRIIRELYRGEALPIHGTFYVHSKSNDSRIKPWPFDPKKASQMLQEEGWSDHDGDGILDKEGKKFNFTITYYSKNPNYRFIGEYIKSALQKIGIEVKLFGVDLPDLSRAFDDKKFDALLMGWAFADPPEDPRQLWYSTGARERGSSNMVSFQNREADQIIDQLDVEFDPDKRLSLYHAFDALLHEEQPYTFLLTPKINLLYRERVKNLFIPIERQDIIPGADVGEPDLSNTWVID